MGETFGGYWGAMSEPTVKQSPAEPETTMGNAYMLKVTEETKIDLGYFNYFQYKKYNSELNHHHQPINVAAAGVPAFLVDFT
jgi:hypothetical protein